MSMDSKPSAKSGGGRKPNGVGQKQRDNSARLRGRDNDSQAVRMSKTLSWLLRHGAKAEGLPMREDGYVKVSDLLENKRIHSQSLDFAALREIVQTDNKKRYDLVPNPEDGEWWIRANQGHSMSAIKLDLKPILSLTDIPSGIAVHGTSREAWELISKAGLSKMGRNHIHIAQGIPSDDNIISGMRKSSQIFIFIDVQKAIDSGLLFFVSENGVILTEGNDAGILGTEFFMKVEDSKRVALCGWEGPQSSLADHQP